MKLPHRDILVFCVLVHLLAAITGCQPSSTLDAGINSDAQESGTPMGVPNFGKVAEGFYRGGQPTDQGFCELKQMGIRTVVSLRVLNSDRETLVPLDMQYFRISFKPFHPEDEDVVEFLKIVTQSSNRPVFVHCREGTDRTGMMVAAYRIVINGWSKEEALAEMKELGFHGIWRSLKHYVEYLDVAEMKGVLGLNPSSDV